MSVPFVVTVWDGRFARVGWVGDPASVTANLRHNQQPSGQVTVRADHQMLPALLAPGARVTLHYRGQLVMSGPVNRADGSGAAGGSVNVQIRDDFALLSDVLGWPDPTRPVTDQGAAEYDARTGPAESVVKWFVARAVARLGLPVTVAPDQGRGATVSVQMRMHSLADRLFPVVDQAGVGVSVRQAGAGLVVDCYQPARYAHELTAASGIVTAWEWAQSAPAVTRVVVGGRGEGVARTFAGATDAAREAQWGMVRETFTDATDIEDPAGLPARAQAAVTAGAPTTGLRLTLAETSTFAYGVGLRVGDLVTARLLPGGAPITDVLREATITWNAAEGLTVTPVVGDRDDDPSTILAAAVQSIARGLKNITTGR